MSDFGRCPPPRVGRGILPDDDDGRDDDGDGDGGDGCDDDGDGNDDAPLPALVAAFCLQRRLNVSGTSTASSFFADISLLREAQLQSTRSAN